MGLLQTIEDRLLSALFDKLSVILKPFKKIIDIVKRFFENVKALIPKTLQLGRDIATEISEWKKFHEAIPFRTGVINLPAAIDHTRQLLDEVVAAWHALVGLAGKVKTKFSDLKGGDPAADAEKAIADLEEGGFKGILEKFPRLAKGFEKVLGWVSLLADVLEDMVELVDDLTTIVGAARDIREEIETGSTVFLQQGNRRKTVELTDGTKLKIRLGNLHPE